MSQTHSEENYLKAIYLLSEIGKKRVNTNDLAESVESKASSATDMIKRLSNKGLVDHQPYKGCTLTPMGLKVATMVIRKHRLWETFLVEVLNFSWDEVHESAEQLEHVQSPLLINRLDNFLGCPTRDPHGDPIPDQNGKMRKNEDMLLRDSIIGKSYKIVRVKDSSNAFLKFLDDIGIKLNTEIQVLEQFEYDDSMKVIIDGQKELLLSGKAGSNLLVNLNSKKS